MGEGGWLKGQNHLYNNSVKRLRLVDFLHARKQILFTLLAQFGVVGFYKDSVDVAYLLTCGEGGWGGEEKSWNIA